MSDLNRYTTFKVRKATGDIADLLIKKYGALLSVYGMDNRSGFVTYLIVQLAKREGLISDAEFDDLLMG